MSRFTSASVERVKDAADMVEIVSAYTDLRRVGERYSALCPFHEERTPSFSVDAREKLYYCFGCEAGGDVFQFVQEKEGLSFPEAVERLAERFGVELELEQADPRAEEARILSDLFRKHRTEYQAKPQDAGRLVAAGLAPAPKDLNVVELAGWTSVARAILNLPEVITRP